MDEPIHGTCTEMCSDDELKLRESQHMLHILEMIPGTDRSSRPRTDKNRIVKQYSRSAAGLDMSLPRNLRTTEALLKTVNYLLQDVISSQLLPYHGIYDFIADRLLAVRQDVVIQRLPKSHYISLLQPIIRFYAYSSYKLCEQPVEKFDPVLNNMQLQECLKKLLTLYDEYEYTTQQYLSSQINIDTDDYECVFSDSRPFFEALYIIFNLGNVSAILRGLSLSKRWRTDIFQQSLNISMAVYRGNWYRACCLIRSLPILLAAVAALQLPSIRRDALKTMSVAYNSKSLKYPIDLLQNQLLYSDRLDVINDCKFYNIKTEADAIKFVKSSTNWKEGAIKPKQVPFVSRKLLKRSIVDLVLHGDI